MEILRGSADPADLITQLARTPHRIGAVARGAPGHRLDRAAEGEWSARTVIAHLRDDEFMVTRLRLERMLAEEAPELVPFDEGAWAAHRWRGGDDVRALVDGFRLQREASVAILQRLTDEEWRRTGSQPEIGTFDVLWWAEHWLEHDRAHEAQLMEALRP